MTTRNFYLRIAACLVALAGISVACVSAYDRDALKGVVDNGLVEASRAVRR